MPSASVSPFASLRHESPPTRDGKTGNFILPEGHLHKQNNADNVILAPSMTPIHFPLFKPAFDHEGYRVEMIPHQGQKAIDTGLAYIHNDACYPAIMSLGQIITALKSGKYDLKHTHRS